MCGLADLYVLFNFVFCSQKNLYRYQRYIGQQTSHVLNLEHDHAVLWYEDNWVRVSRPNE